MNEYIDELKAAESSNVVSKFHRINDEILEKEQDEVIKDLKETFNMARCKHHFLNISFAYIPIYCIRT